MTKDNLSDAFLKLYGERYKILELKYVVHEKDGKNQDINSTSELNKIFSVAPPFLNMSVFLQEPLPPKVEVSQPEPFKKTNIPLPSTDKESSKE